MCLAITGSGLFRTEYWIVLQRLSLFRMPREQLLQRSKHHEARSQHSLSGTTRAKKRCAGTCEGVGELGFKVRLEGHARR